MTDIKNNFQHNVDMLQKKLKPQILFMNRLPILIPKEI